MRILDVSDGFTSASQPTVVATAAANAVVLGSTGTPLNITAAGGIAFNNNPDEIQFIQGSGGAVAITANPQISAGTAVGQRLELYACHVSQTIQMVDGTGLSLFGPIVLGLNTSAVAGINKILKLMWDGTNWQELYRL
jgi:hypothetical protein